MLSERTEKKKPESKTALTARKGGRQRSLLLRKSSEEDAGGKEDGSFEQDPQERGRGYYREKISDDAKEGGEPSRGGDTSRRDRSLTKPEV